MVLFCIMKGTKSTETIEMLFAGLPPFHSAIRWKWFLITSEQPLNRMTDPKVNMALYSPIAGSFSHSSNVDIITSIFYRCPKWYAMVRPRVCVRARTPMHVSEGVRACVCVYVLKVEASSSGREEKGKWHLSIRSNLSQSLAFCRILCAFMLPWCIGCTGENGLDFIDNPCATLYQKQPFLTEDFCSIWAHFKQEEWIVHVWCTVLHSVAPLPPLDNENSRGERGPSNVAIAKKSKTPPRCRKTDNLAQ